MTMTGKLARGLFNAGLVLFAWGVVGSTTMAAVRFSRWSTSGRADGGMKDCTKVE